MGTWPHVVPLGPRSEVVGRKGERLSTCEPGALPLLGSKGGVLGVS